MPKAIECFGVVDGGQLLYGSLASSPRRALCNAEWPDEDGNDVHERLLTGLIKVHCIRIEIMSEATMPPPRAAKASAAKS